MAFAKTRQSLLARADTLAPVLAKYGIAIRRDRLADARARRSPHALTDPRPLHADPADPSVRQTKRELTHTLDQLERVLADAR